MLYMFNDLLKINQNDENRKERIKQIVAAILVVAFGVGGVALVLSILL